MIFWILFPDSNDNLMDQLLRFVTGSNDKGRDPFWWNTTTVNNNPAVEMSPCASGWCGKAVEGTDGDHLQATERMCLQRPPTDGQERCSETFYENRRHPIFMCFCRGDLCNGSRSINSQSLIITVSLISGTLISIVN